FAQPPELFSLVFTQGSRITRAQRIDEYQIRDLQDSFRRVNDRLGRRARVLCVAWHYHPLGTQATHMQPQGV
ncbi:MAG: hypothetical protein ACI87W_003319, partial [Halieaceae bacterium]